MKVGILSFAHMHAYSYASALQLLHDVEFTAVADDVSERGKKAAETHRVQFYQDYQDLLKTDVDAVIVCSENAKHAEMVVAAAEAGKHVLCEKPIATSVVDAKRMVEACRRNNVTLQIAFPMRFNTPVRRARQMVDAGDLGRILAIQGTNRGQNPGGWFIDNSLSGGGAVLDHTVHVVDLMRWFLKSEVREVYAEVDTRFSKMDSDDCGLLMLEFENGVIASHDPSWSRCKTFPTWGDVTLKVVGTEGITEVDAFAQNFTLYSDRSNQVRHQGFGDDADRAMIAEFFASIRENREPLVTGEDGLKAMEVALAAYESGRTGKPVEIRSLS